MPRGHNGGVVVGLKGGAAKVYNLDLTGSGDSPPHPEASRHAHVGGAGSFGKGDMGWTPPEAGPGMPGSMSSCMGGTAVLFGGLAYESDTVQPLNFSPGIPLCSS